MKLHAVLVATAALCATAACTRAPTSDHPTPRRGDTQLVVVNNGWPDAVIYAYYLGQRYRLGTVTGYSSAVLRVPERTIQPANQLQLLVRPIAGGPMYLSSTVTVVDDQHPELTIDPGTNSVFLSVKPGRFVSDHPQP